MVKKTYKVSGMHCTSCSLVIESDLEDAGVKASCSYAKQMLEIEFDEQTLGEDNIKEIIKQSGYSIMS